MTERQEYNVTLGEKAGKLAKNIVILPIRFYKRFISAGLPARCRFYPSCSTYTIQAIERFGAVRGMILGMWRIIRCNPFSRGGVDHVPESFDLLYCFKQRK